MEYLCFSLEFYYKGLIIIYDIDKIEQKTNSTYLLFIILKISLCIFVVPAHYL